MESPEGLWKNLMIYPIKIIFNFFGPGVTVNKGKEKYLLENHSQNYVSKIILSGLDRQLNSTKDLLEIPFFMGKHPRPNRVKQTFVDSTLDIFFVS